MARPRREELEERISELEETLEEVQSLIGETLGLTDDGAQEDEGDEQGTKE